MSKQPKYGPDNPHPLSQLSTELVWEGKYDEYGNRREVDIAGCAMPMQKIETIDEPRREAIAEGKVNLSHGVGFKTPDQDTYEPGSMPQLSVEPYPGFEFVRWHGTIQSPDPNLVLNMYFNHTQIPEFVRPGEMLTNSQFLLGTRAWAYYGATVSSAEGELHIRIPSTTPDPWSIQVSQENIELEKSRSYTLHVTACAARNRSIKAVVGLGEAPWTVYAQRTLNLTITPQIFSLPFTMGIHQPKGRIALDVGQESGDVYVQEVSLTPEAQRGRFALDVR